MSFRMKQKYHSSPCGSVVSLEEKTLETGVVETKAVDQCEKVLPKPELFDLADNLKAGVNLEETSSKILEAGSINLESMYKVDDSKTKTKTETEPKTKEVNDEN